MKKHGAFLIIGGVLAVAIFAGVLLLRSGGNEDGLSNSGEQKSPTPTTSSVVTLEEFGDYQCPPCGALHPALKELKQQFGPQLNFVFRNLPLTMHKNALKAAQAAEAARMQNRFWEMHDLLYERQDLWKDDKDPIPRFVKFAAELGLDTARFQNELDNEQVRFRIQADLDAAARLGINSTPAILINGRQVRPEATNPEGIRKGVEFMMSRQQKSPAGD
jgi:protein-disulfide isomerase